MFTGYYWTSPNSENKKDIKGKWKSHLDLDKYYHENIYIIRYQDIFTYIYKNILLNRKEDYLIEKPLSKNI